MIKENSSYLLPSLFSFCAFSEGDAWGQGDQSDPAMEVVEALLLNDIAKQM